MSTVRRRGRTGSYESIISAENYRMGPRTSVEQKHRAMLCVCCYARDREEVEDILEILKIDKQELREYSSC